MALSFIRDFVIFNSTDIGKTLGTFEVRMNVFLHYERIMSL